MALVSSVRFVCPLVLLCFAASSSSADEAHVDHSSDEAHVANHFVANHPTDLPCAGNHASAGNHPTDEAHVAHEDHPHETLLFMFGILVVGVIILHLTTLPAFHNLQFTVVLFLLGGIFGIAAEKGAFNDWWQMLFRSYTSWMEIDPHLLLFTFLPALLCGDAMTMDTHIARRTVGQCLLLAGPGVLIGAFSTAAFLYAVLPYGWDFWTSLTVGSILAATDPVAVVGLLKELGASPVLTMLIQGESLLNDGTAMVLFAIAYAIAGGEYYPWSRVVSTVLGSIIGAPIVGSAIGLLCYFWIRSASDKLCHSSSLIQISLTLICAYWSFILAEGILHISGVISTVVAAAVLADNMWKVIVDRKAMSDIWHVIETVGNTLVFFIAGAMSGRAALKIDYVDYLWLLLIYVAITFIRFAMLLAFLPLMNRLGGHVSFADVLVMTWGGLRGMVGLALAILVRQDLAGGHLDEIDGDRILFLVGGIAALTLLVNATTSPRLVGALGITATPKGRNALIRNVAKRGAHHMEKALQDLNASPDAKTCYVGIVQDMLRRLTVEVDHHLGIHHDQGDSDGKHLLSSGSNESLSGGSLNQPAVPPTVGLLGSVGSLQSDGSSGKEGTHAKSFHRQATRLLHRQPEPCQVGKLLISFDKTREAMLASGVSCTLNGVSFRFGKQLENIKCLLKRQACDPETTTIVREVFLQTVRADYWDQIERGKFLPGSSEPESLLASVDLAQEVCDDHLNDWETLKVDVGRLARAASTALDSRDPCPSSLCLSFKERFQQWRVERSFNEQSRAVHLISSFIEAHASAQAKIAAYFGNDDTVDSPEQAFVILESQIQIWKAATVYGMIHPQVVNTVNSLWHAHRIAEQFRHFVLHTHESGVLLEKEAHEILHPLSAANQKLNKDRRSIFATFPEDRVLGKVGAAIMIQRKWRSCIHKTNFKAILMHRRSHDDPEEVEVLHQAPEACIEEVEVLHEAPEACIEQLQVFLETVRADYWDQISKEKFLPGSSEPDVDLEQEVSDLLKTDVNFTLEVDFGDDGRKRAASTPCNSFKDRAQTD